MSARDWLRSLGVHLEPEDCPDMACRARGTCPLARYMRDCPEDAAVYLPCGAGVDRRRPSIETYKPDQRRTA